MSWGRYWAPAALLSALITGPLFYDALTDGRVSVEVAGLRFVIGMVAIGLGLSFVGSVAEGFARQNHRRRLAELSRRLVEEERQKVEQQGQDRRRAG